MTLKKQLVMGAALAAGLALGLSTAASAGTISYASTVSVNYYFGTFNFPDVFNFVAYTDTGAGIVFNVPPDQTDTGLPSVDNTMDVGGANTDPGWPGAGQVFGADFTSTISVPGDGTYGFRLGSDDAGYLFIDGKLIISRPGANGFGKTFGSDFLTGGVHTLEVQYDNSFCCGAAVQLQAGVPEPATWGLMLIGFGGLGAALRNSRRRQAAIA